MKKMLLLAVLTGISIVGAWSAFSGLAVVETQNAETAVFKITGMTCGGCEVAVKTAVRKLEGIHQVEASYPEGKAVVVFNPSLVGTVEIKEAIERLGYTAELQREGRNH